MSLCEIIIEKIKKNGPISFHDYMEMALYYPQLGYYTSVRDKIGTCGDYYTSSYVSAAFGSMIGRQLEEMWGLLGKKPFTIIEYGAGTGLLAHDILDHLKGNPSLYEGLQYGIIEKSPAMREKEKAHLKDKVCWYDSIGDIGEFNGCILSNELFDNFAVHQVVMEEDLAEVFVDYHNGFTETLRPASGALKDYLEQLNVRLPKEYRTEVNLQAIAWISEITMALKSGFVLTIDYGFPSAELYREYRRQGTLMCYYQHHVNEDPYNHIGEQDITAHVNFSALYHWGLRYGLECCGFTEQNYFLRSLGLVDYLQAAEKNSCPEDRKKTLLAYQFLMEMGNRLKVLIQRKGFPPCQLSGLKIAKPYV